MSKTPDKIRKTLLHIKLNAGCDSKSLDGYLVHDLVERGYITGNRSNELGRGTAPLYFRLHIKLSGEEYLEQKKEIVNWHTNPVIASIFALVVMVAGAGIIYYLGWQ